jgi:ATP-dependent helicase HrpB
LWDASDRLRPQREPEIHRVDLSATILDVMAWGGDPLTFEWFERPRDDALAAAFRLLERLGAIANGKLTMLGDEIRRLPIHPRLARMLIASGGAREMIQACTLLSERHFLLPRTASTTSDLLSAIDLWHTAPPHVHTVAREIEQLYARSGVRLRAQKGTARPGEPGQTSPDATTGAKVSQTTRRAIGESDFRKAVLAGYPDRVAQRRAPTSPHVRLSSGAGAVVGRESGVVDGELLVAVDIYAGAMTHPQPGPTPARVRVASRVEPEWIHATHSEVVHRFEADAGIVRAFEVDYYDALILAEHPAKPNPVTAATLLADAWLERGPRDRDARLWRRLRFAKQDLDLEMLVRTAAKAAASLDQIDLAAALSTDVNRALEREAPESLRVPSGRSVSLEYGEDGTVTASVKLQELFGLADTPRIGSARVPVLFALLAPNGRPVQITRDLRSFWDRTYPEVRKELRGRYPKHAWPDDPWTAQPTSRTKAGRR